jgi:hypothetical protein
MSKRLIGLAVFASLVLALAFPGSAKADTVYVDGSYAFANGGYGIPPMAEPLTARASSSIVWTSQRRSGAGRAGR